MIPYQNDPGNSKGPKRNLKYKNKVCHFLHYDASKNLSVANPTRFQGCLLSPIKDLSCLKHTLATEEDTAMIFLMVRTLLNFIPNVPYFSRFLEYG